VREIKSDSGMALLQAENECGADLGVVDSSDAPGFRRFHVSPKDRSALCCRLVVFRLQG
jgi:hypothetical protein